ncbi:hypothetical protein MASR2M50_21990 [Thauera sp.]
MASCPAGTGCATSSGHWSDAGWWGEKTITGKDGEQRTTTFDARRLKLIYDTNTRTAYAAGQWERIQRTKTAFPYLRYITMGDEKVRASHRALHNLVLPVDDPFWDYYLPPNGWRCRCRVVAVSQRDYERGMAPDGSKLKKAALMSRCASGWTGAPARSARSRSA